jgi:hypothetical protein
MTKINQKTIGKWVPFAPIAIGVALTAWAALADHSSVASYNDAWTPGVLNQTSEFTSIDDSSAVQISSLRK